MRDGDAQTRRAAWAVAALALLAAPAPAAVFGDVEVTVRGEPRGSASHGYSELEFQVVNRSQQSAREVRLTLNGSGYGSGGNFLRGVSRGATVEPGQTARVSLPYPERLLLFHGGVTVAVDGREQEEKLSAAGGSGARSYRPAPDSNLLVLYSRAVDTRFPDWANVTRWAPSRTGGARRQAEPVRAERPAAEWGANWLGYTRYDGVVVTADDLRAMPGEARNALGQYVEAGGSLLVLGRDPPLPGPWKPGPLPPPPDPGPRDPWAPRPAPEPWGPKFAPAGVSAAAPGFGVCFVADRTDLSVDPAAVLGPAADSWEQTAAPWQRRLSAGEANRAFPVVDDVGVPVKGLLALMLVFALVIGPVNLALLARARRKLWLFWTVPVVSFATCLAVFGYVAVNEGWEGRSRVEGLTVLDETSRRASSVGWAGFYSPLRTGGGLRFGPGTELAFQAAEDPYSHYGRRDAAGSPLGMDWTGDQHLTAGWLAPRVPSHFAVRKSELRRERVTISAGAGGAPEAVNGLGADLTDFWYMDEHGAVFRADRIPAGNGAALRPAPRPGPATPGSLREVYAGDWARLVPQWQTLGPALLRPRTYVGVLDGAPFLDDGLPGASARTARSAVYGIQ